jgi:membrane-bound serine protease (ClpP class)
VTWPIVLLLAAAALMWLEMMIPSFGMLGLLAATAYVFAVVLAFKSSTADGYIIAGAGLVILPSAFLLGFRVMRTTRVGKKTLLGAPARDSIQRGFLEGAKALQGASGVALTDLRPAGMASLGGLRTDVVSSTAFIAKGTPITVIVVDGTRIVVEPARTPNEQKEKGTAP